MTEPWRHTFRVGLAPILSDAALDALREALEGDSAELIQEGTCHPPPVEGVMDWPVEAACPLAYASWRGEGLETVGEVTEFFSRLCFQVDQRMGEAAACRFLLNYIDDTLREEMIRSLFGEVMLEQSRRQLQQRDTLHGETPF